MSRAGDLAATSSDDELSLHDSEDQSFSQFSSPYRRHNRTIDPPSPVLKYNYSHHQSTLGLAKGVKMTPPLDPYPSLVTNIDHLERLPASPSGGAIPHDDSILVARSTRNRIDTDAFTKVGQIVRGDPSNLPLLQIPKTSKHVSISPYSTYLPPLSPIPGSPASPILEGAPNESESTTPLSSPHKPSPATTPRTNQTFLNNGNTTYPTPNSIFAGDNDPLCPSSIELTDKNDDLPHDAPLNQPQVVFTRSAERCRHAYQGPTHSSYSASIASSSGYTYSSAATTMMSVRHFGKFIGSALHSPPWYTMRYITTGFRINYTLSDSWKSLFELHNETAGIWSHIFGFCIFVFLFIYRYNTVLYALEDQFLFWCYCAYYIGSATCMLCSFTFHLFCCCSEDLHNNLYGLDMSAINVMIIGNIMHPVYMMWFCDESDIGFWYAMYALVFGLILVFVQQNSYTMQDRFFNARIGAIIFYGASALIPFIHFKDYAKGDQWSMIITPITITFTFYGVGVLIWMFKFPEVLAPGVFDMGLYSHGIWHTCILIGSLWTESGFMYVLERIVDQTWCELPNAMTETVLPAAMSAATTIAETAVGG